MILGILSDTHNYFHPQLPEVLAEVDLILHAGDVGTPEVLDELERIAPIRAVYGNIDGQVVKHRAPEYQRFRTEGLRVLMTHIGGRPGRWPKGIGPLLQRERPDVFICGHSHILRIERVKALGGMLYLNPGADGQLGFHTVKTCVRLQIEGGAAKQAEVVHLDG